MIYQTLRVVKTTQETNTNHSMNVKQNQLTATVGEGKENNVMRLVQGEPTTI